MKEDGIKMKIKIIIIFLVLTNSLLHSEWELTGPGTSSIISIYTEENNIYAGAGGRIYCSSNKGDSWKLLNFYGSIEFDYINDIIKNGEKIYIASFKGLYTTTDEGENWKLDTIDSQDSSVIWDITKSGNDLFVLSNIGRLFRSTDNGTNWELITPEPWVIGRVIAVDGNNLYVGGNGPIEKPYLWISNDYGQNWHRINDTLTGLKTKGIISLAANGNNVYKRIIM